MSAHICTCLTRNSGMYAYVLLFEWFILENITRGVWWLTQWAKHLLQKPVHVRIHVQRKEKGKQFHKVVL